jgi:phage terminase large subunit-like protein
VELNPDLKRDAKIRNYKIEFTHNHSIVESIPIDPSGEAGSNADMVVFSELWGAHHKAQLRMWTESTLPPAKFGYSQRWIESYAGYDTESELLIQLYNAGTRQGVPLRLDDAPDNLEVWANQTARLFCLWNTQPRLSWQTVEYYAQEAAVLTPNEFNRVHRNQWASSEDTFIPAEWWDACGKEAYDLVRKGEGVVIAMDAGVSSDCFAVVMVTRRDNKVQVQYAQKWQPHGKELDYQPIEAEVRRLINQYNCVELCYDPYQLHSMAGRIRAEEAINVRPFNQGAPRAIADKRLWDIIRDRNLQHRNEPDLREHILAANRKPEDENRLRIVKRSAEAKIDLTICMSMAVDRVFNYAFD